MFQWLVSYPLSLPLYYLPHHMRLEFYIFKEANLITIVYSLRELRPALYSHTSWLSMCEGSSRFLRYLVLWDREDGWNVFNLSWAEIYHSKLWHLTSQSSSFVYILCSQIKKKRLIRQILSTSGSFRATGIDWLYLYKHHLRKKWCFAEYFHNHSGNLTLSES